MNAVEELGLPHEHHTQGRKTSRRCHVPPTSSQAFSSLMSLKGGTNASLLQYLYPSQNVTRNWEQNWVPYTATCEIRSDCYCFHVKGDMSKAKNPDGWKTCATKWTVSQCAEKTPNCACLSGTPCLFSDMRPAKIHAVITAARLAGVTHIVEEGRFGGLSALLYCLHGFEVTSVEFLPLDGPSEALRTLCPQVRQVTGDGSKLVPQIVSAMSREEQRKTMVIFDGEKRFDAYKTFLKVKSQIPLAIFDDSNLGDGKNFITMMENAREVMWHSWDNAWETYISREKGVLGLLRPLQKAARKEDFLGGMNHLTKFHFTIVRGGHWNPNLPC